MPSPASTDYVRIASEVGKLVSEKNKAYGSSFSKTGEFFSLLYPDGITPARYEDALLLARIFDKAMRIATRKDALGESPYRDLCGYALLGAAQDETDPEVGCRLCGFPLHEGGETLRGTCCVCEEVDP